MSGEACTPNIGTAQRRLRARVGGVTLLAALGIRFGAAAVGLGAAIASLMALPLLFAGFMGLIQAREKT